MYTKHEVSTFSCSRNIKGVENFKVGHVTQATPHLGVNFSFADKELNIIYLCVQNLEHVASSIQKLQRGHKF